MTELLQDKQKNKVNFPFFNTSLPHPKFLDFVVVAVVVLIWPFLVYFSFLLL